MKISVQFAPNEKRLWSRKPRKYLNDSSQSGFTLPEVLIVIAILGILLSVAYPSYRNYIVDNRRADARHILFSNASRLDRCFTLAGSYTENCGVRSQSREGYYELEEIRTATAWTLTAIPTAKGGQNKDTECENISLSHIGEKSAAGSNPEECW